ncbi:hypothetical protein SAMN05661080_02189 [Modestobacter sp. DSM 44400]|nr:hypothetical protein SAMN05661080_02189 [Modestobacter sp. DSM 44400]
MRAGPDGDHVRRPPAAVRNLLAQVPASAPVPAMGADTGAVVAHVGSRLACYAHDLVAGPHDVSDGEVLRRSGADLATLSAGLTAWGEVLARVVDASPPAERGWHCDGRPDAAGFRPGMRGAAAARRRRGPPGSGLPSTRRPTWRSPSSPGCSPTCRREDPWASLRWATGRGELSGRPRRTSWRYAAAPTGERGQNSSGHHGVTGQAKAVEAAVTAPGLTSVTRPAACRVARETPPR